MQKLISIEVDGTLKEICNILKFQISSCFYVVYQLNNQVSFLKMQKNQDNFNLFRILTSYV